MHVATAVRYGANGFITKDRRILNKATRFGEAFHDFLLCDPLKALEVSERFVTRAKPRTPGPSA